MGQSQVLYCHKSGKNNQDLLEKIMRHCEYNVLTGQFRCKKYNCIVYIDWSRNYAFCTRHGIL